MTNGEKMQEMFPEGKTRRCRGGVVLESAGWCHAYNSDWWNAEYKEPTTKNVLGVDREQLKTMIRGLTKWYVKRDNTEVGEPNTAVGLLYDDVMFGIDRLHPVTPQSRWISVSERMPEENRTVIASTKHGVYPEARYTKEDGWEWAYESGADYWEEIGCNVLAWMPLPEPYKAESEDKE